MNASAHRVIRLDRLGSIRPGELARLDVGDGAEAGAARPSKLVFVPGTLLPARLLDFPIPPGPERYRHLMEVFLSPAEREVYFFRYHWSRGTASNPFAPSRRTAESVARALADELRRLLAEPGARLVLVGHSLGGVIVRRAVLLLIRTDPEALSRIDRLVLLSSTNRGFEPIKPIHHLARKLLALGFPIPIMDGLRGSPWMSRLRIDWLETFGGVRLRPDFERSPDGDVVRDLPPDTPVFPHPRTIQLDGERDRVVRPDDSDDLKLFGASFVPVTVPGVGHDDFTLHGLDPAMARRGADPRGEALSATEEDPTRKVEALRGLIDEIRRAVAGGHDAPNARGPRPPGFSLAPGTRGGPPPIPPIGPAGGPPHGWVDAGGDLSSLNIVLMIHGIRDYGGWHPQLEAALEDRLRAGAPGYWRVVAIEYGYFSALQFLLPVQQRRIVSGFVDRYLNELTRALQVRTELGRPLPVRIYIAAHSNGTNVLAQAIAREGSPVYFTRAFLAGCVLRRDFWGRYPDRAAGVRNDCATHDWPVGVLSRTLGKLPRWGFWFLGAAGVDGFDEVDRAGRPFVRNNRWLTGDHGAALEPARMKSIASYLTSGSPDTAPVNAGATSPMWSVRFGLGIGVVAVLGVFLGCLWGLYWVGGWVAVGLGLALVALTLLVFFLMLNI